MIEQCTETMALYSEGGVHIANVPAPPGVKDYYLLPVPPSAIVPLKVEADRLVATLDQIHLMRGARSMWKYFVPY